jgi:hypothetical protein
MPYEVFDRTVWSQIRYLVKERASLAAQDAAPALQEHHLSWVCHISQRVKVRVRVRVRVRGSG